MIILDTCAIIFDVLTPDKLSTKAAKAIQQAEKKGQLYCSDISLWEIAMLIQKGRIEIDTDTKTFLRLAMDYRQTQILSINIDIANLSTQANFHHFDPADRLIASTALHYEASLVTCDKHLRAVNQLSIIW